jgi:hypothetical protein
MRRNTGSAPIPGAENERAHSAVAESQPDGLPVTLDQTSIPRLAAFFKKEVVTTMYSHHFSSTIKSVGLSLALAAAVASASVFAEEEPSAKIQFELYKAGFVVGVSGGSGTLTYEGKDYPLSIGGISLGATIGVSKADFVGDVYNLSAPEDIEGVYSGAKAGITIAGGTKTAILKNSKGVELKVSGEQMGVELTLDLNGMSVKLKKE